MTKEQAVQEIITAQGTLIKELAKEVARLKRKNLKLKMHIQVLVGTPDCRTSKRISFVESAMGNLKEAGINQN